MVAGARERGLARAVLQQRVSLDVVAVRMGENHHADLFAPVAGAFALFQQMAGSPAMRVIAVTGIDHHQIVPGGDQAVVMSDRDISFRIHIDLPASHRFRHIMEKEVRRKQPRAVIKDDDFRPACTQFPPAPLYTENKRCAVCHLLSV